MVVTEFYRTRDDGVNLFRSYSDTGHYIIQEQTNTKYVDAVDVENSGYTYIESDEIIPEEETSEEIVPEEAYGEYLSEE